MFVFLAECCNCNGMMGGKLNVLGTIKNETQLKVDSRKVTGYLIGTGAGGTVEQRRYVRRRNTSGAVAL